MDDGEKVTNRKRLIDADKLLTNAITISNSEGQATWSAVSTIDSLAAPIVDVVEIVRCRDCKYWGDEDVKFPRSDGALFARCKAHNYLIDGRHTGWCPTENDFCSYGERKEGAN